MDKLNIFLPLTKADAAQRLVWGTMTAEAPDKSGEILDYASSKPLIQKWSDEIKDASGGKSLGNVRLMHGKTAVGKVVDIQFDDAGKAVPICAKIVDDNAWAMVEEGVLTGFSIGGGYAKRWRDGAHTRYTAEMTEVSVVDNPCLKGATFDLIKADGVTEAVELRGWSPSNDEVKAEAAELAKAAGKPDAWKDYVAKAREGLIERHETSADDLQKGNEGDAGGEAAGDADDPAAALEAALEKADKAKADEPYGDVEYADPGLQKDGKKRYPIDTAAHIRAAWNYINKSKNADKYSADDLAKVKGKIVSAWKDKIDSEGPPSAEKAAPAEELAKGLYSVARTAQLLEELTWLCESVTYERAIEGDDSTLPDQLEAIIGQVCAFLRAQVEEETSELMGDGEDVDVIELCAPSGALGKFDALANFAEGKEALSKLSALLEKVGARNSKSDQAHIQAAHDHMTSLGATCDSKNCPDDEAEKLAHGHALEKAAHNAVVMRKAAAKIEEQASKIEELTKAVAQIPELQAKLDAVLAQPGERKGVLVVAKEADTGAARSENRIEKDAGGWPVDPLERRQFAKALLESAGYAPGGGPRA